MQKTPLSETEGIREQELFEAIKREIKLYIEALNNYVEIIHGGVSQSTCILYNSESFEETFRKALHKYNIR